MRSVDETTGEIIDDETEEVMETNTLRWLADSYMQVQRTRIGMENRLRAYAQGSDGGNVLQHSTTLEVLTDLEAAEKKLAKLMNVAVKDHPAWPWLSQVKGVSGVLGCKLLGLLDVTRAPHASSFWKFCGLAVVDGGRDRLQKGEKAPYSKRAKTVMYLIASSFLRSNSPYRRVYDDARVYYEANRPDWTKAHQHQAALRKMEKLFLAHLWAVWREAEGLPVSQPYAAEKQGHAHVYTPDEFV